MTNNFQLALCLLTLIIGSAIAGAACVAIQLEKVKRQRDEAQKQLQQAYDLGFDQGYVFRKGLEAQDEEV